MAIVNIKNTVIVLNAFHELISRLSIAEERISELEDNQQKLLKSKTEREKRMGIKHPKTEQSMQDLKDNITWSNILICHIIGIPEEKDKECAEEILEDIRLRVFQN